MSHMPRSTFFQLPEDKRERVLRAAITEFAGHGYLEASLDRIAEAASVSKGSLYQYFHHKEDCYAHAVRTGIERAAALFEESLERDPPRDCFDLFARALLFVVDLRESQRDLALLYVRAGFLTGNAPARASLPLLYELAGSFNERVLSWGIAAGGIDPGVDRRAAGFLMDALSTRFHAKTLIEDAQYGLSTASRRELFLLARRLTQMLRHALSAPQTPIQEG
jgi:AcrR family transcriptional regulator